MMLRVREADGYAPIRDYAIVGDGRTAALIGLDGSVDWLCLPDFDSPSVLGRLLDAGKGGRLELTPVEPFQVTRRYRSGSNVLETTFETASGSARVSDAMTLLGTRLGPARELVRRVEGLSGTIRVRVVFEPRFDYGRRAARIAGGGSRFVASHRADAVSLSVWGAARTEVENGRVVGELVVAAGETAALSIGAAHAEPLVFSGRDEALDRLEATDRFWREWSATGTYEGPWQKAVVRSALTLKLLVYAPSGAIVAAPTSSLPEEIGGTRNWDYRYAWVRDACWTTAALLRLGYHDEVDAFFWWLMHTTRLTQPRLGVLYRVNGDPNVSEVTLDQLSGYRASRPVRIGNGARNQLQLDVYGSLLHAVWLYVDAGHAVSRDTAKEAAKIADWVVENWQRADAGIWETRSPPTHYTQSKAMCWVALDRACALADRGAIPDRSARWRTAADEIRSFVEERAFDEELGYVRAPALRESDASLLTLALLDWSSGADPRLITTVDGVRRQLARGPLVDRYRGQDGLEGDEGAFLTCSFWLVDALARTGRHGEAAELMDELVSLANDVGLYSEELDPASGAFLGNFPQALSHLALVNAAVSLAASESRP